jgi:hypothetical protein
MVTLRAGLSAPSAMVLCFSGASVRSRDCLSDVRSIQFSYRGPDVPQLHAGRGRRRLSSGHAADNRDG